MADEVEEVLNNVGEADSLSFYALVQVLAKAERLLTLKSTSAEVKDELREASAQLRKEMGALLETPALTMAEKPMADQFLEEQLRKLATAGSDPKAAKKVEKLQELLVGVRSAAVVVDSPPVRSIKASMKKLEAEWKEVSPLYDKWQAGRHNFKSNDDLQAFQRRYNDCKKGRDQSADKLETALRARRDEAASAAAIARDNAKKQAAVGWNPIKKAAPPPKRPGAAGVVRRPAAPPARPGMWSAGLSMAQQMRAQVSAGMREQAIEEPAVEGEEEEEAVQEEDSDDDAAAGRPAAPPPPPVKSKPPPPKVVPKGPPVLPAELQVGGGSFAAAKGRSKSAAQPKAVPLQSAWGGVPAQSESEDDEPAAAPGVAGAHPAKAHTASAKKKGKAAKKRKGGGAYADDDDAEETAEPSKAAPAGSQPAAVWASAAESAISGSLLQDLLSSDAWVAPPSPEEAVQKLEDLIAKLPWESPLGLVLPMEWKQFVGLEFDGGPKRTSKRGDSPWMLRLKRTIPMLLTHYLTIIFFLSLLHSLSTFGLVALVAVAQVGLILTPSESVALTAVARARLLQVAHLLLWILFVRSLWQFHFFIKCGLLVAIGGHAYVLADIGVE